MFTLEKILSELRPSKALHIGASFGQEAIVYHQFGVEAWHIEAIPEVFDNLEISLRKFPKQHAILSCLSSQPGVKKSFKVANNDGMSSSLLDLGRHQKEYPGIIYEREIAVVTDTIDSLIDNGKIPEDIDFLLIDAQGAELLILDGADRFLSRSLLKASLVETAVIPLYDNGATYLQVADKFSKYNLHLRHASFGNHGWTDALFQPPYWSSSQESLLEPEMAAQQAFLSFDSDILSLDRSAGDSLEQDYQVVLKNECAIAESSVFCPWDKPAFEEDLSVALGMLIPTSCAKPLVRIGGDGDGAYLVPDDLFDVDACFSPGVADIILFEQQLSSEYSIPSYMCDASVSASDLDLHPEFHVFSPMWIGGFDGDNTHTLDSWVSSSRYSESKNLLLQMDIEGAEYTALLAASDSILSRFKIIVIEFHGLGRLESSRFLNTRFLPTLYKLDRIFDCVHVHANNCCGTTSIFGFDVPNVLEVTYYRKTSNAVKSHPPLLPHPLDVVNVPSNPEIILGRPWQVS